MPKLLVWDLEIKTPVHENPRGWEGARQGENGISALVVSDSQTSRFHIYGEQDLEEAVDHLNSADLLIGYNTIGFDSTVVYGCTGRYITVAQYDILHEIYKSLGHREKGWKLDEVAKRTLGEGKSGNGAFATQLVKQGEWGKLFDYCLSDVALTKKLFNHIVSKGWLLDPKGEELHLDEPCYKEIA